MDRAPQGDPRGDTPSRDAVSQIETAPAGDRRGGNADRLGSQSTSSNSAEPSQLQALRLAADAVERGHRWLAIAMILADEVAVGIEAADLLADLDQLASDLRLIASGGVDIDDLPMSGMPTWAAEFTCRWREERDRKSWRRSA